MAYREPSGPPRRVSSAVAMSSKLETLRNLDALAVSILLAIGGLAVAAGYAALHFGCFCSPWEFAAWLFVCTAFLVVGLQTQTAPQ